MRIRILSDLHLEASRLPEESRICDDVECDLIVLAGDIHNSTAGIAWAARTFERPTVYVMGNHEYYGHDAPILLREARALAAERGVYLLERDEIRILGQRFLGCTLWTGFDSGFLPWTHVATKAHPVMADFSEIRCDGRLVSPSRMAEWYDRDVAWLEQSLRPHDPAVVITHFVPTWEVVNPKFGAGDEMTAYFHSNLEHLMGDAVPLWIYGHNHWSDDAKVETAMGSTRVVSNQLGYRDEKCGFLPGRLIEL